MPKATTQQTNALITLFLSLYENKYSNAPVNFNRYREKWGFQGMIDDLGYARAREVVQWYFELVKYDHPSTHLLYNYDRMNKEMIDEAEDEKVRAALRAKSKIQVEEWRAANGK